jgi:hypothetical protein
MRSFGVSKATGRRSVPRAQAPLVAVLSMSAGEYPAALIDVSRTGARLRAEILPPVGQGLTFTVEDVHASAGVVWSEAGNCAIEFDTPIAVAEVQRLRSLGVGAEPPNN